MDSKFGFKDMMIFVFLAAVIVSVWLAIKQYDRQYVIIKGMEGQLQQLISEQKDTSDRVERLERRINQGINVSDTATTASQTQQTEDPPFITRRLQAAHDHDDFTYGDWRVDTFPAKVAVLSPLTYKDYYANIVHPYLFDTLVWLHDDDLTFVPQVAERWEIEDNCEAYRAFEKKALAKLNAQAERDPAVYKEQLDTLLETAEQKSGQPEPGTTDYQRLVNKARQAWADKQLKADPDRPIALKITFFLRKDVNFSDGHPLTSEDLVFTLDLMNNPKVDCPHLRNFYDIIEKAQANGPYEVTFHISKPHYMAMEMCGNRPILPKHFYSKYTPQQINENPGLILGSGPYRMKTVDGWRPGQPIELVRNERYWGPKPALEKMIWHQIDNEVARQTKFENGDLDYFLALPEQYVNLKKNSRVMARAVAREYPRIPSGYRYIGWNLDREGPTKFTDKRVRQAMTFLTPRRKLCEEVFLNYATPRAGPWTADSPQSDPDLTPRLHDLKKGLALLKQVGWADTDGDGVLDKDGKPFRFTLTYPSGSATTRRVTLYLKDAYARAGIIMDLEAIEWSVFHERTENRTFDAVMLGWGGGAVESDIRQMFHSSQIGGGADNYGSYSNPKLDALIDQARTTIDRDKRMALWNACHRILYEDQPYTFLNEPLRLEFIDRRFKNVSHHKTGVNDHWEWYVPAPQQKYK